MPEIKRLEPLTDWITFELEETPFLTEPTIKVRLRYLDSLEAADELMKNEMRRPLATAGMALQAVVEWDLTEKGKPIPVNEETKVRFLRPLLGVLLREPEGEKVEGEEGKPPLPRRVLAYEIAAAAADEKLFLKN